MEGREKRREENRIEMTTIRYERWNSVTRGERKREVGQRKGAEQKSNSLRQDRTGLDWTEQDKTVQDRNVDGDMIVAQQQGTIQCTSQHLHDM